MKKKIFSLFVAIFSFIFISGLFAQSDTLQTPQTNDVPKVTLSDITLAVNQDKNQVYELFFLQDDLNGNTEISINGETTPLSFKAGKAGYGLELSRRGQLLYIQSPGTSSKIYHVSKRKNGNSRIRSIPMWMSIIPPMVAILLALIFKEVYVSLFLGIWSGAFIVGGLRIDSLYYFFVSIFEVVNKYVIAALIDGGHMSVIIFSLLIGGMVAIISKNGGMAGVVVGLSKYAKSARSTQFITWLLGVAIFFDDYANTLIVGNTMRSVTDRFKISREKLAYIVDSTAAPVSAIAFITTWIGAELGYIDDGMAMISLETDMTAYGIFLSSLKYSFYPVLTLIFILIIIYTGKDYGAMAKAEKRARTTGQVSPAANQSEDEPNMEDLSPVKGAPLKAYNAIIPVAIVILMTIFGLVDTGFSSLFDELSEQGHVLKDSWGSVWNQMGILLESNNGFFTKLGKLIGSADSYIALLWASASGLIAAIFLTISGKIMKLFDTMHWMATGFKTMLPALIILALAWSLAITTEELHTADFLSAALQDSLNPYFMPIIIFVLSAFIAFSTGSSWSTMAILYPIAIPTTFAICQASGMDTESTMELLLNVIATVLAASVLGDHCSPISDTTILSSLASDCNHIDHVRTQLPYALTVGGTSLVCLGISSFLGGGAILNFILLISAVVFLYIIVSKVGRKVKAGEISEL